MVELWWARMTFSGALLCAAFALLVWPTAGVRTSAVRPAKHPDGGASITRPFVSWAPVLAASIGAALWSGIAAAAAALVLALTVRRLVLSVLLARRESADRQALGAALAALSRELRSGTAPEIALESVAAGAPPRIMLLLRSIRAAGANTLGRQSSEMDPCVDSAQAGIVAALQLSVRHGVPLAGLVEVLAADLTGQIAAGRIRAAQVAGPRFSGFVLAGLPGFGVLLGIGIGADPLAVLFGGNLLGSVLLVVGTILTCTGLLWSARIVAR